MPLLVHSFLQSFYTRTLSRMTSSSSSAAPTATASATSSNTSRPAHHRPDGKGFVNPWPSFISHGIGASLKVATEFDWKRAKVPPADQLVKVLTVDKEKLESFSKPRDADTPQKIVATWLGHACFLVQVEGVNILFDPVFSDRCSPVQFAGPKRYTPPPCKLEELPRIDIVVISHNHYDHLDLTTIKFLEKNHHPKFFVPLGNKAWFHSIGIQGQNVTDCDWWDSHQLKFGKETTLKVTCTPCQHFTGRSLTDRFQTLWASWVVEVIPDDKQVVKSAKVYFSGDTGYRSVPKGADQTKVAHCPAFKEIGERFGPFDLSFIAIGAYSPRWFMSPIHCSPDDSVCVHQDVKSKKSLGMHFGCWVLTDEDVTEAPRELKRAMEEKGLDPATFNTCSIGETVVVDV